MGFLPTLQYQLLAEPVASRTEQFEIRAKLANRENLQTPRSATSRNLGAESVIGVDDGRCAGRQQFLKQPHLRIKIFFKPVSYTHLRAHETVLDLVCRLLLEKKKQYTS